jgi:hypothetical protein
MAKNEAARSDGQFIIVSSTPDVCKTPPIGVPVPYPIVGKLHDSFRHSPNVNFRGKPAKTMNSRVTKVTGNEAGSMGGVKSTVNIGHCKPVKASATFRVNGYYVLYANDTVYEMNCPGPEGKGNTLGKLTFCGFSTSATASSASPDGSDPEITAETAAEESFLSQISSVEGIGGLATMAPQLATMDWSNPAGVLGSLGGLAGLGGLSDLAQAASIASTAAGIIQDPKSALGLLGPLGDMAGIPGSQVLGLATTDWTNPGSIMGAATNLGGMTGCFGGSSAEV